MHIMRLLRLIQLLQQSRILSLLARLMPTLDETAEGGLRDANGNRVGYWSYTIDES